jgi:hypothetical protein
MSNAASLQGLITKADKPDIVRLRGAVTATSTLLITANGTNAATNSAFFDSGPNGRSVTSVSKTSPSTTVPIGTFSPYSSGQLGSVWFDNSISGTGSQNRLELTKQSDFCPTANTDFTFECWLFPTSLGPATRSHIWGLHKYGLSADWAWFMNSSGIISFYFNGTEHAATTAVSVNVWSHVAFVRIGTGSNNVKCYVNGVLSGQFSDNSTTNSSSTNPLTIGQDNVGSANAAYQGYATDFRIVNGTGVYSSAFSPPTSPLTAVTNTTLLLNCRPYNNIYDVAAGNPMSVRSNTSLNTTTKKYGSASVYMTGSSSGIQLLNSKGSDRWPTYLDLKTTQFTIDGWVYLSQYHGSTRSVIIGSTTFNTLHNWSWHITTAGYLEFKAGSDTITSATALGTGAWVHVAITRLGNKIDMFKNGVNVASGTLTANINENTVNVNIGCDSAGAATLYGYVDDLQLVKSIKYPPTGFTAPAAEATTVTNVTVSNSIYGIYRLS